MFSLSSLLFHPAVKFRGFELLCFNFDYVYFFKLLELSL